MGKTETLTAYACKFSYLQRNNPLIKEQGDLIRAGKQPQYSFSEFVADYSQYAASIAVGENADRAIQFSNKDYEKENIENGVTRWRLTPRAGKQGQPVTVMEMASSKKHSFGADAAALYDYNAFVYEGTNGSIIAIFHRRNGSGCKSVFLETANKALKSKGLKLEMILIMPLSDSMPFVETTGITLQYVKNITSSDIADSCKPRPKKVVIQNLGLNLEVSDNHRLSGIVNRAVRDMQLGKIDRHTAFAKIKAECPNSDNYNDAEMRVRIGTRYRTVNWNDVENWMGSYDISERLHLAYALTKDFDGSLKKLADEYYGMVVSEGTD